MLPLMLRRNLWYVMIVASELTPEPPSALYSAVKLYVHDGFLAVVRIVASDLHFRQRERHEIGCAGRISQQYNMMLVAVSPSNSACSVVLSELSRERAA